MVQYFWVKKKKKLVNPTHPHSIPPARVWQPDAASREYLYCLGSLGDLTISGSPKLGLGSQAAAAAAAAPPLSASASSWAAPALAPRLPSESSGCSGQQANEALVLPGMAVKITAEERRTMGLKAKIFRGPARWSLRPARSRPWKARSTRSGFIPEQPRDTAANTFRIRRGPKTRPGRSSLQDHRPVLRAERTGYSPITAPSSWPRDPRQQIPRFLGKWLL